MIRDMIVGVRNVAEGERNGSGHLWKVVEWFRKVPEYSGSVGIFLDFRKIIYGKFLGWAHVSGAGGAHHGVRHA